MTREESSTTRWWLITDNRRAAYMWATKLAIKHTTTERETERQTDRQRHINLLVRLDDNTDCYQLFTRNEVEAEHEKLDDLQKLYLSIIQRLDYARQNCPKHRSISHARHELQRWDNTMLLQLCNTTNNTVFEQLAVKMPCPRSLLFSASLLVAGSLIIISSYCCNTPHSSDVTLSWHCQASTTLSN